MLLIPTWIVVGVLGFFLIQLAPGDPAAVLLGQESREGLDIIRMRLGLDKPLLVRLGTWMWNAMQGNLGESFFLGRPVSAAILERLPATLSLAVGGVLVAIIFGVTFGVIAALKPNSWRDMTIMGFSLIGLSIPEFLTGFFMILLFSVGLAWLPSGGYQSIAGGVGQWVKHIIMPVFALGLMQASLIARTTRSSLLEVLNSDYVRTARSKGLRERKVVWKHAFKNAMLPVVTVIGMIFAQLLSGTFITEALFRIPGVGNLLITAVKRRDYPVVQGGLLLIGTIILLINLTTDILYAYFDPRIRYE